MALFQSRAGFSGRLDARRGVPGPSGRPVSIPCWVFWASRPQTRQTPSPPWRQVSIPCWVFWASRPWTSRPSPSSTLSFNPVLGFLGVSTHPPDQRHRQHRRFNPVLGFLGVSTGEDKGEDGDADRFNPVLGFLGVSTRLRKHKRQRGVVSIPCWVFWASRLSRAFVLLGSRKQFQSRAGFSGRLDTATRQTRRPFKSFNPVLGFLGVSTPKLPLGLSVEIGFNPVLGFLGVSTGRTATDHERLRSVSIPCWVFWASRQGHVVETTTAEELFQSRAGFSGRLDQTRLFGVGRRETFQSRAGFSGRLDNCTPC